MKKRYFHSLSPGLLVALTALACILSACPTGNDEPDDSIILCGTIGAITVNGKSPPGEIRIQARNQNSNLKDTTYDGSGAWSLTIPSTELEAGTSISFRVRIRIGDSWLPLEIPEATQTYNGNDISGIALGDVSINSVTLSGTIGAITVNDKSPPADSIYIIQARKQDNGDYLGETRYDGKSGAWSIPIPTTNLKSGTSIRFQVNIGIDDFWLNDILPGMTKTYNGSDISDIDLGVVSVDAVTLSGTIGKVTVNGASPSGDIYIQARKQNNGQYLGETRYEGKSGAWSITIPSTNLESGTSIRFQVNIRIGDSWQERDIPEATQTYDGKSISGIALGDVALP
jgi:hypothetical protein